MADSQVTPKYDDLRILLVEDNPSDAELLEHELKTSGLVFTSRRVESRKSYVAALRKYCPDLILSDYDLPSFDGFQALKIAKKYCPEVPFILVTGVLSEERVIDVLTSGATDYVLKERLSRLLPAVKRALHESYELRRRKQAETERDVLLKELELKVQARTEELEIEVVERRQAEDNLLIQNRLLEGMNRILQRAIASETEAEIGNVCLSVAEELTQSGMSFIGEIKKDGQLHDISISNPDWEGCTIPDKARHRKAPGQSKIHGLYGYVIEKGASLLTNSPAEHWSSVGLPEGHPPLSAFLGVPLLDDGKTMGLLAVGNREGGYTPEHQSLLEALAPAIVQILFRKRAEAELRKSDQRFRALMSASSEALYKMSPDWSEMRQLNCGGFLTDTKGPNASWLDQYICPEDQELVISAINEAVRKKSFYELEHRVRRADGSTGWILSRAIPITDANGEIIEWLGAAADITERKEAEEKLRDSEEKYRLIFESSRSGILIIGPDAKVIRANPAAQKILGMKQEEIILRGRDGITDTSDPRFQKAIAERARTGKFLGELNWKKKDGTTFPVEISSVITRNQKGEAITSIIFTDITWRKHAEKILMESAQNYREMADAMPQLVWTATPEGSLDYVNRRHEEFPCLVRQPSGFWDWTSGIHPEDLRATMDFFSEALRSGKAGQIEHRIQDRSGVYRWYLTRRVPVYKRRELAKWIGTTTDVNDLKETESALKGRTLLLEAANKELESFSYSVSHDLRAPLRAIEGFSRMLLDDERKLDRETNRRIQIIRENTAKMNNLINDLLFLSRSGRAPLSSRKIDMDRLIKEIWEEQLSANPDRKMELKKENLPKVNADETLIRQVLSNLLANAVKFTRKKRTALIEIGGKSDKKETLYWIRDNGTGFDMKYYDKLFGVFQRLHNANEYEGTGVGLAIVQRIIHRHGGRVWAEGKPGKGATFYFSLPSTGKYQ